MFFSHGYTGSCKDVTTYHRYMASYGVTCIAPTHNDGSSGTYTTDSKGKAVDFNIQIPLAEVEGRSKMLDKRVDEIRSLVDEVKQIVKKIPGSEKT